MDDMKWLVKVQAFEQFGGHPVTISGNRSSEIGPGLSNPQGETPLTNLPLPRTRPS